MRISGICELTLEATDVEAMRLFYESVGLERLTGDDGDRQWLSVGDGCRLGFWTPGKKEHDDRGGRHVHFALSVTPGELGRVETELRERGYEVEGPIEHEGGDRSIYVDDPQGNRVELWDFFERQEGRSGGVEALAED